MEEKDLVVQLNSNFIHATDTLVSGITQTKIMVTPPIDEDYWLFRVAVSSKQAIIGFPKFGVIGIGFQHEEYWNTNLPSSVDAQKIFKHISCNKGDNSIPDSLCISAIELIQKTIESVEVK